MSTTMQAFVLTGETHKQVEYITQFKKEKNITPYLISEFEDFKIAEARNLQRLLSAKLHQDEFRLILIKNPTLDSQNALLKTLEELPDNTYVLFVSQNKDELLPTILSRTLHIDLGSTGKAADDALVSLLKNETFTNSDVFRVLEKVGVPTEETLETLILSVRLALFESLQNTQHALYLSNLLKKLTYYYAFSKSNNINKQMIVDAVFFDPSS